MKQNLSPTLPTWIFLILLALVLLFSCSTKKQVLTDIHTVTDTTSVRIDTIVNTRMVPYVTPEDSALIQLGLRCDSNGRVLISNYSYEHARAIGLEYSLDSLNQLMLKARQIPDTVLIPVNDTTINKTLQRLRDELAQKQTTVTEYVDKPLAWYNKVFLWLGKVLSTIALLIGLYFAGRYLFKLYLLKR